MRWLALISPAGKRWTLPIADSSAAALAEGFSRSLNLELSVSELTAYEHQLAEQLNRDKYHTDEWNFLR